MTSTQKVIKYCALAFAICLIVGIVGGIVKGVLGVGELLFGDSNKMDKYVYLVEEVEPKNITSQKLSIEVKATNIKILKGGSFSVQTNNKNIRYYPDEEEIVIKDKSKKGFNLNSTDTELIIEIPEFYDFDSITINSGAGKLSIKDIKTSKLDIDLGAGSLYMNSVTVRKNANIDGGAGSITIDKSSMNNLDLEIGTGSFNYYGDITGKSSIECGVGGATIDLTGKVDDYQIHVEKGVGSITADNKKVSNDSTIGNGENIIDIDGGIGSIKINYNK